MMFRRAFLSSRLASLWRLAGFSFVCPSIPRKETRRVPQRWPRDGGGFHQGFHNTGEIDCPVDLLVFDVQCFISSQVVEMLMCLEPAHWIL